MRAIAIIPAHNEAANLAAVVAGICELRPRLDLLVVDDASVDGTAALLPRLGVRYLSLAQQVGVGGAVRAGLRFARILGYEHALRLDGDGQHLPGQLDRLLEPVLARRADAVVGSRFCEPSGYRASLARRLVHRALAVLLSRLTGEPVTDPTSGFWAFGPRAVQLLGDHYPKGYSEPELRLFLARNGLIVIEVPVTMQQRQGGRSSLTLPRALLALARTALVMVVVPLRAAVVRRVDA